MDIAKIYNLFKQSGGSISTDTRNVAKNTLFFALKGTRFNGNEFAEEALLKGAAYVIIDECEYKKDDKHYICVKNVLKTLQLLASYHIKQLNIPLIGITGTNGKTTTKELIREVLSTKYNVAATRGNYNNEIGVPLTLLSIDKTHELAIVEMGAAKRGDIKELCDIAHPSLGIITGIGVAHIQGFGSPQTIFETKTELFDAVLSNNGHLFINAKINGLLDKYKYVPKEQKHIYGDKHFIDAKVVEANPFLKIEITDENQNHIVESQLIGTYNLDNILAAYTIGKYFKIPITDIQQAIKHYRPTLNRSQYMETQANRLIVDAYNANPSSMKAALSNFFNLQLSGDKVLILGDMLELGTLSKSAHAEIVELIANHRNEVKETWLVGNEFQTVVRPWHHMHTFPSTEALIAYLKEHPLKDKLILLKGSRGIALEKAIKYL